MVISTEEFQLLQAYAKETTGLVFDISKKHVIDYRLQPVLREEKCASVRDLYFKATRKPTQALTDRLIDALTVNETSFFRDKRPFELLSKKIFPDLLDQIGLRGKQPRRRIQAWSAACSTGQEAMSIAMTAHDFFEEELTRSIYILGTDISEEVLTRSSQGIFTQFEVDRGLNPASISKFFSSEGQAWRVKDSIRGAMQFKKMNLLKRWPILPKFDLVFCRYVAIYFSEEDRRALFERITQQMNSGGWLVASPTDTVSKYTDELEKFNYHQTICYRKK